MNLVKTTCLSRNPRPTGIDYYQGSEFIGHEFRKSLIEMEYGIAAKPSTLGKPTSNEILERIHQVLENLVRTLLLHKPMLMKTTHGRVFWLQQNFKLSQ